MYAIRSYYVIQRASDKGLEIVVENHWGPTKHPENLVKLLDEVDDLGLLFDSNNWAEGKQQQGWLQCAAYARSVHIKTFEFDANGNDPTVDIPQVVRILVDAGYDDVCVITSYSIHYTKLYDSKTTSAR